MKNSGKTKKQAITTKLPKIQLYNTLSRKLQPFTPLHSGEVLFYSCGPTVYYYAHIGNMRTYIFEDILRRVLAYAGYRVTQIMNVTDVGHLTGDNLGDADVGEDRIEKSAREQGKTAWDIAQLYTDAFLKDLDRLNILRPTKLVKATDHIKEMIELIWKLEKNGYAYVIADGVYFDTSKFKQYGRLSGQKAGKRPGARIEPAPGKKNLSDFALWKFSRREEKRQMEWESPWGRGFPGWHIECSAMSMKYLGDTFDLHTGGEDHIPIHHENEIAQSEAATGKPFVRFWLHGYFMTVDGKRMGKSEGNAFTLQDLIDRGYDPLAFRYLVLQSHYRTKMNFTWEALAAAQQTLQRVRELSYRSTEKSVDPKLRQTVEAALYRDLDTPKAVALLHEAQQYALWQHFDEVLGLGLGRKRAAVTPAQQELINAREQARQQGNYQESDRIRKTLAEQGIVLEDTQQGPRIIQRT